MMVPSHYLTLHSPLALDKNVFGRSSLWKVLRLSVLAIKLHASINVPGLPPNTSSHCPQDLDYSSLSLIFPELLIEGTKAS